MLRQEQRQVVVQRVDPKLILANTILQQNTVELAQYIEAELLDNPALDVIEEDSGCAGDCIDPRTCPDCSQRLQDPATVYRAPEPLDVEPEFYPEYHSDPDDDYDPVGSIEAELTLAEHLRSQLRAAVPETDFWIGDYLIANLDDNGWLDGSVAELADEMGSDEADVLRVLRVLHTLDPPGVGARDLRECLLIQLQFLREEGEGNAIAERLVRHHFPSVVSGRYRRAARQIGVSADAAAKGIEFIRESLNPYPASQFRAPWSYKPTNGKAVVRPDVVLRRTEVGYDVEVTSGSSGLLGVNPSWREAYERARRGDGSVREEDRKRVTEYVERAENFIRNLNQRRKTLRSITKAIVDMQHGFLETGSRKFIRPLTRSRVAEIVGLHESTISRATSRKYVQLPNQEVVAFDVFFNSSLAVKSAIEEIIASEDPAKPLSDRAIVERLSERGYEVARRTVVKYREAQKLLSSASRRRV